ncbi:MAG: hypothetical protein RID23_13630 [Roseovarius sp.]
MAFLSVSRSRARPHTRRRASLLDLLALVRQRRKLAELDDAALRDMGLTRREALDEARRPAWDVPHHWIR